ncbi:MULTISPECIES: alpha/beta hydrolase [unclassified Nonomuraea]|uniref:poly(ethylene terephthalate) hydrolase family protein n=1 Tax=unclassified Nonomuraea TaxID=2593643 RepID=UPI0034328274
MISRIVTTALLLLTGFPVETSYTAPGPWAVTTAQVGTAYRLHYPADLGAGGFRHPVVTWGNGTNTTPEDFPGILNQLASWGFVVIAATSGSTGSGTEMLAGVRLLEDADADPASVFHGKLDLTRVGAIGSSQGAMGAINAANHSGGLIRAVVAVSLPAPWAAATIGEMHVEELTCPVFFASGGRDLLLSPYRAVQAYYDSVPGPAAMAILKDGSHTMIKGAGSGPLGYVTAWLMYTLQDNPEARTAFVGSPPELDTNTAWERSAQKNLQ